MATGAKLLVLRSGNYGLTYGVLDRGLQFFKILSAVLTVIDFDSLVFVRDRWADKVVLDIMRLIAVLVLNFLLVLFFNAVLIHGLLIVLKDH